MHRGTGHPPDGETRGVTEFGHLLVYHGQVLEASLGGVCHALLRDASLYEQLLAFDHDLAAEARAAWCAFCEGILAAPVHDRSGAAPRAARADAGYAARGFNSYWTQTYGPAVADCDWSSGQPASPTVGPTCGFGTCFAGQWRADDRWQANSFACINIVRNGEFNAEVPSISPPMIASGGGSGVFDGQQSLAQRVAKGRAAGILGEKSFPGGGQRTFGVTMAVAYPSNLVSTGILAAPWKHNFFRPTANPGSGSGLLLFHNVFSLQAKFPFMQFIFFGTGSTETQAGCTAKVAAATIRKGTLFCNDAALGFDADSATYQQATAWPLGTWGCVQGHYRNLGNTNMGITISLNGVTA